MHPNARWAFARYRAVAHRLPQPQDWPKRTYRVLDLQYVLKRYDGFILDAFGILNVGEGVLPQAVERVAQMRAFEAISGCSVRARAMLVMGPIGTIVVSSSERITKSAIAETASGRTVPGYDSRR